MSLFDRIDQPTLLLNEAAARTNIQRMAQKVDRAGVRFRPHFKTHQSAEIGTWFRDLGVDKITVSSVEMAEYFAANGWQDILIAFSLNIRQLERVRTLADKVKLSLLVENLESIEALSKSPRFQAGVWIKIDAGARRTGVDWQETEKTAALIEAIQQNSDLTFMGLLTHSGNTYHCENPRQIVDAFREGVERMNISRRALEAKRYPPMEVSVGDTPGCSLCSDFSGIDELRPGNFVFYDAQQLAIGSCKANDIAVAVACPVVAIHPERREVTIYGGAIHLSKDLLEVDGKTSYGLVAFPNEEGWDDPLPGAVVRSLSQEHGILHFANDQFKQLRVGDLVCILPAHSCLTVQLLRKYLTLTGKVISTMNI
jgi:D-serine deaminase-like pyridoxal phosphate-dependent protein